MVQPVPLTCNLPGLFTDKYQKQAKMLANMCDRWVFQIIYSVKQIYM